MSTDRVKRGLSPTRVRSKLEVRKDSSKASGVRHLVGRYFLIPPDLDIHLSMEATRIGVSRSAIVRQAIFGRLHERYYKK